MLNTIGLYNATMELNYTIKATPVSKACPVGFSGGHTAAHLFSIND